MGGPSLAYDPAGNKVDHSLCSHSLLADLVLVCTFAHTYSPDILKFLLQLYRCYMIWGRSRYVLIGASILVLADTGNSRPLSFLPYQIPNRVTANTIPVWGYLGLGQSLIAPDNTFVPLYVWSIFAINIVLAIVTGTSGGLLF